MFCVNCGNKIEETSNFCSECGAELGKVKNKTSSPITAINIDKQNLLPFVGGVLLIISFFMPWVDIGFKSLSGFNLFKLYGITPGITKIYFIIVWLVPIAGGIASYFALTKNENTKKVIISCGSISGLVLYLLFFVMGFTAKEITGSFINLFSFMVFGLIFLLAGIFCLGLSTIIYITDIGSDIYAFAKGGFWRRFIAFVIDTIIIFFATAFLAFVAGLAIGLIGLARNATAEEIEQLATLFVFFIGIFFGLFYFTLFTGWNGQTPGKRALGLRVVRITGESVGYGKALLRYAGYYVSFLLVGLGFVMIAVDNNNRSLHDLIAGTCVQLKK